MSLKLVILIVIVLSILGTAVFHYIVGNWKKNFSDECTTNDSL